MKKLLKYNLNENLIMEIIMLIFYKMILNYFINLYNE